MPTSAVDIIVCNSMELQAWQVEERAIFEKTMNCLLKCNTITNTPLQRKIARAAWIISEEVNGKTKREEAINFHFYTSLADNLMDVYHNPVNKKATQRLAELSKYASKTSSVGDLVSGILLVVLGALLMLASIVLINLSFGVSLGLVVPAAGLIYMGVELIDSGMPHGLSQDLLDIKKDADKHPEWDDEATSLTYSI